MKIALWECLFWQWIRADFWWNSSKNHLISIAKHNVSRTRFSLFRILSFPIGKLKKTKSKNHVLKTLCFAIEMIWLLMNSIKDRLGFIVRTSISRVRFSLFRILSFPIGKVKKMRSENHALETLCFPIEMIWFLMISSKITQFWL